MPGIVIQQRGCDRMNEGLLPVDGRIAYVN